MICTNILKHFRVFYQRGCTPAILVVMLPLTLKAQQRPYAIPDSPAFTFLEVSPTNISRPTSPRAFSTALLSGIDSLGRIQQGFALDAAPWSLIPGVSINLDDYQEKLMKYMLANTQLSVATVKVSGDSSSTDIGMGLRLSIYDGSDPMSHPSFTDSLTELQKKCANEASTPEELKECQARNATEWRRQWLKDNWNKFGLSVASGTGWRLNESRISKGKFIGWSLFTTTAFPLKRWAQVLGQLRYDNLKAVRDSVQTDLLSYGMRWLIGTPTFNFFVELTGIHDFDAKLSESKNSGKWSGGTEFRVGDKTWISTGFGSGFHSKSTPDRVFLIANMRWEISTGPQLRQ